MNIAVNTRLLLPNRMEGISRYIYETTKRIVATNPQHQFFFFFDRPYDKKYIFGENVTAVVIPPPTRHPVLWYYWFEYALPRAFKKYKIDAFYSGDMYLSLKSKIPTVMVSHDLAFHHYPEHLPYLTQKYYNRYSKAYHQHAKTVIAVSQSTKDDIIRSYGINPQKIIVAYNDAPDGFYPIDEDEKIKIRNEYCKGKRYFIYLGSVHPRKNIINLLKAFELFKKENTTDYKLMIFGRKAWKNNALDMYYNSMQYKEDVIFISNEEGHPNKFVAASEALIYISLFEGFGIPILEAFHAGVPVITSNVSSMPEVAKAAALTVDPYDIKEIAKTIAQISSNPKLRLELIKKGNERKQDFNWDTSAKIISNSLNQLS